MIKKMLIIDDEEINIRLIKMLVKRLSNKFEIFEATSGKEAIEIIKKTNLDIVLVDILLPDMNGFEIIKKINNKKTKIIILSALSKNEVSNTKLSPKVEYLSKPLDIDKFSQIIKEIG